MLNVRVKLQSQREGETLYTKLVYKSNTKERRRAQNQIIYKRCAYAYENETGLTVHCMWRAMEGGLTVPWVHCGKRRSVV